MPQLDTAPAGNALTAKVIITATATVRDKDGNVLSSTPAKGEVEMPLDQARAWEAQLANQNTQE